MGQLAIISHFEGTFLLGGVQYRQLDEIWSECSHVDFMYAEIDESLTKLHLTFFWSDRENNPREKSFTLDMPKYWLPEDVLKEEQDKWKAQQAEKTTQPKRKRRRRR